MKSLLRYQISEFDCAPTTFNNALIYFFEREELSPLLLNIINKNTMDYDDFKGTSVNATKNLAEELSLISDLEVIRKAKEEVNLETLEKLLADGFVCIIRVKLWVDHYVLITKCLDKAYIFDPYFVDVKIFDDDDEIEVKKSSYYNRVVSFKRIFEEEDKNYSLVELEKRDSVFIKRKIDQK